MVETGRDNIHVAVCCVTGAEGREIVERFQKVNALRQEMGEPLMHVRGFTRDSNSLYAKDLQEQYPDILTMVDVKYESSRSLRKNLTGCQALYLKCTIAMTQTKMYERIIDYAAKVGVKHIIYSSVVECDQDKDHGIPHWDCARHTEGYLAIRQDETKNAFTYHILRYAHVNDNLLPGNHHAPSEDGWIAYPYHPSIRMHTASARDGARVACKLFCQPNSLKNGAVMNMITDFRNPHEMAQFITLATGKPVQAFKGPATLLVAGHLLGYEKKSIVTMGEYIEKKWTKDYVKSLKFKMEEFLREEIEREGEPLETLEAFVNRSFGGNTSAEQPVSST